MIFLPPVARITKQDEDEDEPTTNPINPHPLAEKIQLPDGSYAMDCVECLQRHQWAESNQENGTFMCYNCRTGM